MYMIMNQLKGLLFVPLTNRFVYFCVLLTSSFHAPGSGNSILTKDGSVRQQPIHNIKQPLVFARLCNLSVKPGIAF